MELLKLLNVVSQVTALAPTAAQLIGALIIGIQHAKPGSSGEEKKQAVVEIAAPILAGLQLAAPGASEKVALAAGQVEDTVQNVFDLIKLTAPQTLKVHADNSQAALNRTAAQPGNQPTTPKLVGSGSGTNTGSDDLAAARARVQELEAQQRQQGSEPQPGPGLHNVSPQ